MQRSRVWVWALLFVAGVGSAAVSEDVNLFTKQHLDSRGGYDRLNGLQRYELKGTVTRNGETLPMKLWWKHPNKLRIDVGSGNNVSTTIFDGQNAWTIRKGESGSVAVDMDPADRLFLIRQADFAGPLVESEKKQITVTPDPGTWGAKGYLYHISRNDGKKEFLLVDPNLRLPKTETYQLDAETFLEQKYSKYRRSEGFAMPSHIERFVDGKLVEVIDVTEMAIGPEMPDTHFAVKP